MDASTGAARLARLQQEAPADFVAEVQRLRQLAGCSLTEAIEAAGRVWHFEG